MGQKVNPVGLRLGINKTWESKWYASNKDFSKFLNLSISASTKSSGNHHLYNTGPSAIDFLSK